MATAHDLHPRQLWDGEVATRGDLHFADSFCRNSSMTSPPMSVIIRLSDDVAICDAVARAAEAQAAGPHIGYDWWTLSRILMVVLVGRIPFVTLPVVAVAPVAWFVESLWVSVLVGVVAVVGLYRGRDGMHRLALAVPWPDPPDRMICSEVGRLVIESVFTADALPGLFGVEPSMTAPGDLLLELLHRCDRGTAHGR